MQISAPQMRALDALMRQAGNRRLAAYVEERFPGVFGERDEPQRLAVIERMREAAAVFGFERDDHIGFYIDLHLMYGPGFASEPWAAAVLRDPVLGPLQKVRALQWRVRGAGGQL